MLIPFLATVRLGCTRIPREAEPEGDDADGEHDGAGTGDEVHACHSCRRRCVVPTKALQEFYQSFLTAASRATVITHVPRR